MSFSSAIFSVKRKPFLALSAAGLAGLVFFLIPESCPVPARRMAFIFVLAAAFWALEIIPLYATSLLVILLEIFMLSGLAGSAGAIISYTSFYSPFANPVILLFFGGFVLAAAMHKYQIDGYIASHLMKFFGHKPIMVLIGFMVTTAFLSMWMSNTATTAMMLVMITPLLKHIKSGDPFRKALVLAIAFGANIGGVGTPVGTPPNAIAIGVLAQKGIRLNFLSWMVMAVPLAIILLILAVFILHKLFPSNQKEIKTDLEEVNFKNWRPKVALGIGVLTAGLWLTSQFHHLSSSVVALLAAGLLFSVRLLDRVDMNNLDWDILVLMWGGLALGEGMALSGLTNWLVNLPVFGAHGFILFAGAVIMGTTVASFISHTATANLLVPIVISLPGENAVLLAVATALACSFGMALPVSTPPNAMAFSTEVIGSKDLFRAGVIISAVASLLVIFGGKLIISTIFGL